MTGPGTLPPGPKPSPVATMPRLDHGASTDLDFRPWTGCTKTGPFALALEPQLHGKGIQSLGQVISRLAMHLTPPGSAKRQHALFKSWRCLVARRFRLEAFPHDHHAPSTRFQILAGALVLIKIAPALSLPLFPVGLESARGNSQTHLCVFSLFFVFVPRLFHRHWLLIIFHHFPILKPIQPGRREKKRFSGARKAIDCHPWRSSRLSGCLLMIDTLERLF